MASKLRETEEVSEARALKLRETDDELGRVRDLHRQAFEATPERAHAEAVADADQRRRMSRRLYGRLGDD